MSMVRKLRGLAAGVALAAMTIGGAVSLATPSQAADMRFGIVLTDHDRRPPARYEARPPAPHARYSRWERGHWAWTGRRWVWASGHYEVRRHRPHDPGHWQYVR